MAVQETIRKPETAQRPRVATMNAVHDLPVLVARDKFVGRELAVHHAIQALGLIGIAVHGVLDFLGRVNAEMVGLAKHRSNPAHLEHQPLQHVVFLTVRFWQKLARFGGEVQQDGT